MIDSKQYSLNNFLPNNSSKLHLAIIPDGARRWAKLNGKSFDESYQTMVSNVLKMILFLYDHDVDVITIYFSSIYNFSRPISEIDSFCKAETDFMHKLILPYAAQKGIKVRVPGNRKDVPEYLVKAIEYIEQKTNKFTEKELYLCVNYSSICEIAEASQHCSNDYVNHLWIPHPVNILIRSGGASVLSDFLLVQSASARLFFLDKLFNDLSITDIQSILADYSSFILKYGE